MASLKLGELSVGQRASVKSVSCARPTAIRLMEMGLLPGAEVEVRRVAPLGDPIELRVSGYALSIRKAEADHVSVELASDAG